MKDASRITTYTHTQTHLSTFSSRPSTEALAAEGDLWAPEKAPKATEGFCSALPTSAVCRQPCGLSSAAPGTGKPSKAKLAKL